MVIIQYIRVSMDTGGVKILHSVSVASVPGSLLLLYQALCAQVAWTWTFTCIAESAFLDDENVADSSNIRLCRGRYLLSRVGGVRLLLFGNQWLPDACFINCAHHACSSLTSEPAAHFTHLEISSNKSSRGAKETIGEERRAWRRWDSSAWAL